MLLTVDLETQLIICVCEALSLSMGVELQAITVDLRKCTQAFRTSNGLYFCRSQSTIPIYIPFSPQELENALKEFIMGSSPGSSGITAQMLYLNILNYMWNFSVTSAEWSHKKSGLLDPLRPSHRAYLSPWFMPGFRGP